MTSRQGKLHPGLSLYLDLVRLLAALAVFGFHMGYGKLVGDPFGVFHAFGSNGVIVFFVLSGFVITHVLSTSETSSRSYAIARLSRLYSVVIPALLLTAMFDFLGQRADPGLYLNPMTMDAFIANLFFVNSLWHHYETFGTMGTYWSLGFEVWYYLTAGLFVFCRGYGRIVWPLAALLFAGPNIVSLLPLWLLGVVLYRLKGRLPRNALIGVPLFVLPVVAFFITRSAGFFAPIDGSIGGGNSFRDLGIIYTSAALFAVHLAGAQMIAPLLAVALSPIRHVIRWAVRASFTLYLMHLPLAYFIAAHDPWQICDWRSSTLVVGGTLAGALAIAEISERRKAIWRRLFSALLPPSITEPKPRRRTAVS